MQIIKSESTDRPAAWDVTTSPSTVYHNFNVEEVPATDDTPARFVYDQEQYTRAEYDAMQRDRIERLEAAQDDILIALAALYEGVG